MKLLNCQKCHDIISLGFIERKCLCGASRGKYINEIVAIYSGPSRILGIRNSEYKVSRPEHDYVWFVIPEGNNIKKLR